MKKLLILITISLFCYNTQAQNIYQDTTKYYSFEINYWFNLHHFLWLESFMNVNADSTIINQELPKDFQKKLDLVLEYYKKNLTSLDLRTSEYMTEFKHWVTKQDKELKFVPKKFQQHVNMLKDVSDGYKNHFWSNHKTACIEILDNNIELIRQTEEKFVSGITKLTRQFWQLEKLKVHITYF